MQCPDTTLVPVPCCLADKYMNLAEDTAWPWIKLSLFGKLGLNNGRPLAARENIKVFCKTSKFSASPGSLTEHQSAGGSKSSTGCTPSSSKRSKKTSSVLELPACFKLCIHPFVGLCHNTALDPSKLGLCPKLLFAGSFLGAFSATLV